MRKIFSLMLMAIVALGMYSCEGYDTPTQDDVNRDLLVGNYTFVEGHYTSPEANIPETFNAIVQKKANYVPIDYDLLVTISNSKQNLVEPFVIDFKDLREPEVDNDVYTYNIDIAGGIHVTFTASEAGSVMEVTTPDLYYKAMKGESPVNVVQTIPAGYNGDFILANSSKVLLLIEAGEKYEPNANNINLKYQEGCTKPSKLEIQVVGEGASGGFISGNLPYTHVDFTAGKLEIAKFLTSSSTFEIISPAYLESLKVLGGNVVVKGAQVDTIEVVTGAVADDETKAPVQIVMEKYEDKTPSVLFPIDAYADVIVAPAEGVTVLVNPQQGVNVANGGQGEVLDATNENEPITQKAVAKIGDVTYITLAAAIEAVKDGETIIMQENVTNAAGISVPSGKNFIVNFNDKSYSVECPGAGSAGTQTIAFQLLEGSTIQFENGTIQCTLANKDKTWSSGDSSKGIAMMIQNYANLTLNNMVIDGTNIAHNGVAVRYLLSNNCGNVEYKGDTKIITAGNDVAFDVCKYANYDAPIVKWNSTSTISGSIELSGGEFIVASNLALVKPIKAIASAKMTVNANITPAEGWNGGDALVVVNRKGDLTIAGTGTISYNGKESVFSAVKMTEKGEAGNAATYADRANLTLDGATLEGFYYGICGNGNRHDTDITINSGVVRGVKENDCAGIYNPQKGTLTINGGTIEGAVGVYVKSGFVSTSITGGLIKGIGAQTAYVTTGDGLIATGDAIVFDNCDYPGGQPDAIIEGGQFMSVNGAAVASYAKMGKTPIGGFLQGGLFSSKPADELVAEGFKAIDNSDSTYKFKVVEKEE